MTDKATAPRYLDTRQFARLFGFHVESVRRLIRQGEIPARKVGHQWRIPAEFVEKKAPQQEDTG